MEVALEAGADDVRDSGDLLEVLTAPEQFEAVKDGARERRDRRSASAEVTMMPPSTVADQRASTPSRWCACSRRSRITTTCRRVSSNMDIAAEELERLSA